MTRPARRRFAKRAACNLGGTSVKIKDSILQIIPQQVLKFHLSLRPSTPRRHAIESETNFEHCYGRRPDRSGRLPIKPGGCDRVRLLEHQC